MARSQETWSKKEREKKKQKSKQEKAEKKLERKAAESKSFDEMLAYVDENGNLSEVPPDPTKKKVQIKAEDIQVGVPKQEDMAPESKIRKGTVTFFNYAKGYGFINDQQSNESIFVHVNNLKQELKENDVVTFELERGPKGFSAVNVEPAK